MAEKLFITNSGLAEITKAQKAKSKIKITDIGLGTGTTASHTATALQSEIKKVKTFKGGITTASEMELYITDKTADAYKVSEVGLFDGAGNLLAIYSTDAPEGLESKTAESFLILVLLIKFKDSITALFDFKTKAPAKGDATTTKAGVFELATDAELEAHTAKNKAITCEQIPTADQLQALQNRFNVLNDRIEDQILIPGQIKNYQLWPNNTAFLGSAKFGGFYSNNINRIPTELQYLGIKGYLFFYTVHTQGDSGASVFYTRKAVYFLCKEAGMNARRTSGLYKTTDSNVIRIVFESLNAFFGGRQDKNKIVIKAAALITPEPKMGDSNVSGETGDDEYLVFIGDNTNEAVCFSCDDYLIAGRTTQGHGQRRYNIKVNLQKLKAF